MYVSRDVDVSVNIHVGMDMDMGTGMRTIAATVWHTAWPIAPPMKRTSAMQSTGLRPVKSDRIPATRPPMSAPSVVEDVMSSWLVVRWRCVGKEGGFGVKLCGYVVMR